MFLENYKVLPKVHFYCINASKKRRNYNVYLDHLRELEFVEELLEVERLIGPPRRRQHAADVAHGAPLPRTTAVCNVTSSLAVHCLYTRFCFFFSHYYVKEDFFGSKELRGVQVLFSLSHFDIFFHIIVIYIFAKCHFFIYQCF